MSHQVEFKNYNGTVTAEAGDVVVEIKSGDGYSVTMRFTPDEARLLAAALARKATFVDTGAAKREAK